MLPANKKHPFLIYKNKNNGGLYMPNWCPDDECFNLYFLSNEEIKEGDWAMNMYNDTHSIFNINRVHTDGYEGQKPNEKYKFYGLGHTLKKIIACTDKTLKFRTYQGNCGHYITHEAPRPSNEFIKLYCEKGGIEDVLVEYVDNGEEDWMGDDYSGQPFWNPNYQLKVAPDNTITIKPVKDSWSREEVEMLCSHAFLRKDVGRGLPFDYTDDNFKKWKENNL